VLRKEDDDWVKKCTEYEVEGPRPRGRPKRTWREVASTPPLSFYRPDAFPAAQPTASKH